MTFNPFILDSSDSSVDECFAVGVLPVDGLAIVDAASNSTNNSEVNSMNASINNSTLIAAQSNAQETSMFRYQIDLTAKAAITKGGSVTVVASTTEGAVIKNGAYGTWMENLLPYEVELNTDKANAEGWLDENGEVMVAQGWVKIKLDDIFFNHFVNEHGVEVLLARYVKGISGRYDTLAPSLVALIDEHPEALVMNAQVKIDLDASVVFRDGAAVEVHEELFDIEERDFKSICIYWDDFDMSGLNSNPNTGAQTQNFTFINYKVELLTRRIGKPMGIGKTAAATRKSDGSIFGTRLPATNKGSDLLKGLEAARVKRSAGIGSVVNASTATPGSAFARSATPVDSSVSSSTSINNEEPSAPAPTGAFQRPSAIESVGGLKV